DTAGVQPARDRARCDRRPDRIESDRRLREERPAPARYQRDLGDRVRALDIPRRVAAVGRRTVRAAVRSSSAPTATPPVVSNSGGGRCECRVSVCAAAATPCIVRLLRCRIATSSCRRTTCCPNGAAAVADDGAVANVAATATATNDGRHTTSSLPQCTLHLRHCAAG